MKAPLYSKEGKKKGEVVLNPEIYGQRINQRLLNLVLKGLATNLRRGNASTKTRKEVRGGGRKPWKQKGTGRARHSSIRSPIWRGGGTVFGPHPKDYYVPIPDSMRNRAIISALSLKADQKNLLLLEDATIETPKTKEWMDLIKSLPLKDKRVLCVVREISANLKRASRNAKELVEVKEAREMNVYHILQREKILIEQTALPVLEERLLAAEKRTQAEIETQVSS